MSNARASSSDITEEMVTCPVTQQIFHTPVLLHGSGITVEEYAAKKLDRCPITRKPIKGYDINYAVKENVSKYLQGHPEKVSEQFLPPAEPEGEEKSSARPSRNASGNLSPHARALGYGRRNILHREYRPTRVFYPQSSRVPEQKETALRAAISVRPIVSIQPPIQPSIQQPASAQSAVQVQPIQTQPVDTIQSSIQPSLQSIVEQQEGEDAELQQVLLEQAQLNADGHLVLQATASQQNRGQQRTAQQVPPAPLVPFPVHRPNILPSVPMHSFFHQYAPRFVQERQSLRDLLLPIAAAVVPAIWHDENTGISVTPDINFFKGMLLGHFDHAKSLFLAAALNNDRYYKSPYASTLSTEFKIIKQGPTSFQIWDTVGQGQQDVLLITNLNRASLMLFFGDKYNSIEPWVRQAQALHNSLQLFAVRYDQQKQPNFERVDATGLRTYVNQNQSVTATWSEIPSIAKGLLEGLAGLYYGYGVHEEQQQVYIDDQGLDQHLPIRNRL